MFCDSFQWLSVEIKRNCKALESLDSRMKVRESEAVLITANVSHIAVTGGHSRD